MHKAIILALLSSTFAGCGGSAPPPIRANAPSFSIVSEKADPATSSLALVIAVPGTISQSSLKALTESVIAERRSRFRHIIVTSYADEKNPGDKPLAVSTLDGDTVSHSFNPEAETQRIQTH